MGWEARDRARFIVVGGLPSRREHKKIDLNMKILAFIILSIVTFVANFDGFLLNPDLKKWLTDKDDRFLSVVETLKRTRSMDALTYVGRFFLKVGIGLLVVFVVLNFLHIRGGVPTKFVSLAAIYSITVFLCIKTFRNPVMFVWEMLIKPSRIFALILLFPVFDLLVATQAGSPSLIASFYEIVNRIMTPLGNVVGFEWPKIANHWLQAAATFLVLEAMVLFVAVFIGWFYFILGLIPFLVVWLALRFTAILSLISPKGPLRALILLTIIAVTGYLTFS
jgi:hypothetical protein